MKPQTEVAMTEKIMQCCYTNAVRETGGKISSGWQPVAVSGDLPSDAYAFCVKMQNANSTLQSHMEDENGDLLNLYEVAGDGTYIYVSRTRFGLLDRLNRPNMFSHTYVFRAVEDGAVSDPNVFLSLDRSNFADNEEDALKPRPGLLRLEALTIWKALELAGMNRETYLTLIRCVYSQYSERKAAKPLFVGYDGSDEQLRAILYCIYWGVPFCMRKTLSAASAETNASDSKNIVFSRFADRHELYVLPQTGENSALTPRTERKIARYGFVDHAVRNLGEADAGAYFAELEKLAVELGDATASNELTLKIAHQLTEGMELRRMSDEELDSRLSDALRSRSSGSARMDGYIGDMLDEVRSRGMYLTEENESNLEERLRSNVTRGLADAGERYGIYRLHSLPADEAAKLLARKRGGSFERCEKELAQSPKGLEILDTYYADYYLGAGTKSWEALHRLLDDSEFIPSRKKTTTKVVVEAWNLYCRQLSEGGGAVAAMDSFLRVMGRVLPAESLEASSLKAREKYWELVPLGSVSPSDRAEYEAMAADLEKSRCVLDFCSAVGGRSAATPAEALEAVNSFFVAHRACIESEGAGKLLAGKAKDELARAFGGSEELSAWVDIAALAGSGAEFACSEEAMAALRSRDYDGFISACARLARTVPWRPGSGAGLAEALGRQCLKQLRRSDSAAAPAPLDAWLLLGAALYPNCFAVVGECEPEVLRREDMSMALASRLMREPQYLEQAEAYASGKGADAKLVRKFVNEFRISDKRRRAQEQLMQMRRGEEKGPERERRPREPDAGRQEKKGRLKDIFGRR